MGIKKELVPGVVVVTEKHETLYFHAPDEATLHRVALMILKGRKKSGYWYGKPEEPKAPDYTDLAEIRLLRGEIQKKARAQLHRYTEDLYWFRAEADRFEAIQKAAKEGDGALAWKILQERSDYEYESVVLVPYETSYSG